MIQKFDEVKNNGTQQLNTGTIKMKIPNYVNLTLYYFLNRKNGMYTVCKNFCKNIPRSRLSSRLPSQLNISREKFIRTYVGSQKLSEVLFTFFSPGSVMEIFLCVCTVHTYVRDYGYICTTYFSNRLVHSVCTEPVPYR